MDSAGFSSTHWNHWLLVVCFVAISSFGLWNSWQWSRDTQRAKVTTKAKAKLARRLAVEIHSAYVRPVHSHSAEQETRIEKNKIVEASGRFRTRSRQR